MSSRGEKSGEYAGQKSRSQDLAQKSPDLTSTQQNGDLTVGKQGAKAACTEAAAPAQSLPQSKEPLLVGLDGGWVCSREQRGGMEGKVAVVCAQLEDLPLPVFDTTFSWSKRGGPRRQPRQRHRLTQRRYVATFGPARQLGVQAKAAGALESDPARPVVVLADGAEWIKQEQGKHFPQATCILDWAHLWREVRSAILAASRAKALPQHERDFQLSYQRTSLWLGKVEQAVQGLQRLATGLPTEALKPL